MKKFIPLPILCVFFLAASVHATRSTLPSLAGVTSAHAPVAVAAPCAPAPPFTFRDAKGIVMSAPLVEEAAKRKLSKFAKVDPTLDPALARAATIAQERANAHSKSKCWRYVKEALLAAGAVDSYPKTEFAKEAGDELVQDYGFKQLPVSDPFAAPIGAVLVYTAKGAPGHVELRTKTGFVSDFKTKTPSKRKLIGVYAKA